MKTTSGCVIKQDGTYLMVQEKSPTAYGLWNLPAGHVDPGETPEMAAVRETQEETGFQVEIDGPLLDVVEDERRRYAFAAHIVGGEENRVNTEVLQVARLSYEEIEQLEGQGKIRAPWVIEAIRRYELASSHNGDTK